MQIINRRNKIFLCAQILLIVLVGCTSKKRPDKYIKKEEYYEKCMKIVLDENRVGQEYFFKIEEKNINEFKLTYLGYISTAKSDTIKFLNAINYFGQYVDAKHAKGYVFLYNKMNENIGCYYVGGELSVPTKIEGSNLVFRYSDKNCNQTTAISFLDSIPNQIFINCTKDGGDLYSFTKE